MSVRRRLRTNNTLTRAELDRALLEAMIAACPRPFIPVEPPSDRLAEYHREQNVLRAKSAAALYAAQDAPLPYCGTFLGSTS